MEHFQKKIRLMREVIDTIKIDIEAIRTKKATNPIKHTSDITLPHSKTKSIQINKQYNSKTITSDSNPSNTNFNNFKTNCPIKKEHNQISLTLSTYRNNFKNKTNTCINHNREASEANKVISNIFQNEFTNYNKIAKMPDTHQRNTINEYNYKGNNVMQKQPNHNTTFNKHNGVSNHLQRVNTEINTNKSEEKLLCYESKSTSAIKPQQLNNRKHASKTICYEEEQAKVNGYKNTIDKLIEISNIANNNKKSIEVSYENIIAYYQNTIIQMNKQNELIAKMLELYESTTKESISNNADSHMLIWQWMKSLSSQSVSRNDNNTNEYKTICHNIMKRYNLKTINEFGVFIDNLMKKSNKNDCFIEGITNILLTNKKKYH